VDHRVEVVRPAARALAPVGERDVVLARERFAERIRAIVRDIPHAHRVGVPAELAVAHDQAEAADDAAVEPVGDAHQRVGLGHAGVARRREPRARLGGEAALERGDEAPVLRVERHRRDAVAVAAGARALRRAVEREAQVDPVVAHERQAQHGQPRVALDRRQRLLERAASAAAATNHRLTACSRA
jgi:hypothetical protein